MPVTVIYDAQCGFCSASRRFAEGFDTRQQLHFVSMHEPDLLSRFPQLHGLDLNGSMHVLTPDGRVHREIEAVRAILRQLPGLQWMALLFGLPGVHALGNLGYRWVARNRMCLMGSTCRLPQRK
jgi:predicted DCC family thiol-disulfide oxidoreductase YuxK